VCETLYSEKRCAFVPSNSPHNPDDSVHERLPRIEAIIFNISGEVPAKTGSYILFVVINKIHETIVNQDGKGLTSGEY
jgi:hypothetical protein